MKRIVAVVALWLIGSVTQTRADAQPSSPQAEKQSSEKQQDLAPICARTKAQKSSSWCKQALFKDIGSPVAICVEASDGCLEGIRDFQSDSRLETIPPNRPIVVIVRAQDQVGEPIDSVSVSLGGTAGQSLPMIYANTESGSSPEKGLLYEEIIPYKKSYHISHFAPRTPGAAQLTVSITRNSTHREPASEPRGWDPSAGNVSPSSFPTNTGSSPPVPNPSSAVGAAPAAGPSSPGERPDKRSPPPSCNGVIFCNLVQASPAAESGTGAPGPKKTTYAYEFYVPHVYGGALRLGIGAIRVHGLEHNYGIRKVAGSDFSQIVDNGADPVNMEIVVGYAPFLASKIFSEFGGRTYMNDENPWLRIAPYFGFGAIVSSNSKIEWLRSLYVGIEYELMPGSSLALTTVIRRVDALANRLSVGMPVADGTNLTRVNYEYGWGVVFNFTPAFFQFATSVLPK